MFIALRGPLIACSHFGDVMQVLEKRSVPVHDLRGAHTKVPDGAPLAPSLPPVRRRVSSPLAELKADVIMNIAESVRFSMTRFREHTAGFLAAEAATESELRASAGGNGGGGRGGAPRSRFRSARAKGAVDTDANRTAGSSTNEAGRAPPLDDHDESGRRTHEDEDTSRPPACRGMRSTAPAPCSLTSATKDPLLAILIPNDAPQPGLRTRRAQSDAVLLVARRGRCA